MTFAWFGGAVLACYILSYQIMHTLARVHAQSYFLFRLILFPGVVIHELAHILACLLTGTAIHKVSFWDESGGHVIHEKPRWPIITQPIISFAPFPVGLGVLFFLSQVIDWHNWLKTSLVLFLMVSVAGTFAPSKADFVPAVSGTFLFVLLLGLLYLAFPNLILRAEPSLQLFTSYLQTVVIILAIIWLILHLFHRTLARLTR